MITKVTKENSALYRALFEKATAHYNQAHPGEDPIDITSLDDYFCSFKSLADLDMVYTVLPLDEPFFEIDANTRVIKVPNEFKTNGISVKGDQIAEIVYFTIDRYYDTIDLYDDDVKIYIQWEAPNGKQDVYREIMKDITILESQGKMLFGWTIDNNITAQAGTLKFSVRFISVNSEQDIVFSLSTLTASAVINPGLDFEFNGDVPASASIDLINNTNLVRNRFKNSAYHDVSGSAVAPEFLINIPKSGDAFFVDSEHEFMDDIVLNFVDLDANGQYKFVVSAVSSDAGSITYDWHRANVNTNLEGGRQSLTGQDEYVLTSDTVWGQAHPYYTYDTQNGVLGWHVVEVVEAMIGEEIPSEPEIYEKTNIVTATQTGDYWVDANNRKGRATNSTTSQYVRIPGPEPLSVTVNGNLSLNEAYDEHAANEHYTVILEEDGTFDLSVTGATARLGKAGAAGDKISYIWSNDGSNVKTTEDGANGGTDVFSHAAVDANDRASFDEIYSVAIKASRNGDDTEVTNIKFRVTDAPHLPTISVNEREIYKRRDEEVVLRTNVVYPNNMVNDETTYQWYHYESEHEDYDDIITGANESTLIIGPDSPYTSGIFYCIVTNRVNDLTVSTEAPTVSNASDNPDRGKYISVNIT